MKKPILYMQTDSRWANIDYSAKGEKTTIGKAGCGPTCAAMVIAEWVDKGVNPITTCKWSLEHGYKAANQGTYYSYFKAHGRVYGLEINQLNSGNLRSLNKDNAEIYHKTATEELNKGNLVIACMGKGLWTSSGHFVLVYGVDGNTVYINDSNSTKTERTQGDYKRFKSEVKYYFVCKNPKSQETHSDNYYKVSKKYGFSPETMEHVEAYAYAEKLMEIMLLPKIDRKLQIDTVAYLLKYKYGVDLLTKLSAIE